MARATLMYRTHDARVDLQERTGSAFNRGYAEFVGQQRIKPTSQRPDASAPRRVLSSAWPINIA